MAMRLVRTMDGDYYEDDGTADAGGGGTPTGEAPRGTYPGMPGTYTTSSTQEAPVLKTIEETPNFFTGPNTQSPQDWQQWFLENVRGIQASPSNLASLKSKLEAQGVKVLTNANGVAGKIQLPDGRIIDVGGAFSSGNPTAMTWQWLEGADENSTDWFDEHAGDVAPYQAPERPQSLQTPYEAPVWGEAFQPLSTDEFSGDPGYQARLKAMQQAQERSAAARGTVLSGGFIGKALPRAVGEFASNEYGQANNRKLEGYQQRLAGFLSNAGLGLEARKNAENEYQNSVNIGRDTWATRYKAYRDAIGDQFRLAENGLTATTAGGA